MTQTLRVIELKTLTSFHLFLMHNIVSQGTKSKLYVQYYLTKDEDFEKVKFDARS